ncbi:inhibitor of Bruton tyrosine kinase-like [Culicoides brevitarsis]|uniref:inhibitor of Bruton tyrosine kinase-like n=1 Tax=Culicoides brevitarsis TaxID=469753 RepID=UPI00307CB955
MHTIATYDYDCTRKCRKSEHGNSITAALTKRSISNEKLARFIAKKCRNFAEILDDEGRSALHLAVSVGDRYDIVEFLLRQGASVNLRDRESGQSSLTRAVLYGNLAEAVLLARNGATLMPDNDFINPLQYCHRVKKPIDNENRCETFVWGKNKNYNIGIGNVQEKTTPDYLDAFRKARIYVQQVSMSSFHTMFVTDDGDLYVTGHGTGPGGRLGTGDELTLVSPKKVKLPFKEEDEKIIDISAGKNHSLVLTNKNRVYATGSNSHSQLGIKSIPEMLLSYMEIPTNFSEAKNVIANDYSSIVVTNTSIYGFGTNIGQFGLRRDVERLFSPRKINTNKERFPLDIVATTNAAVIFYSSTSALLYILYKYETKIYKKPLMERITQISATGGIIADGHKNCQKQDKPLRFIVLTEFHNVFIWYEATEKFVKCSFTASRYLEIDKIVWSNDEILLSYMGNLYKGSATHELKHKTVKIPGEYQETYVKKEVSSDQKTKIELKRIPFIDKVIEFCSDPEGDNFVALVENSRKYHSFTEFIEKSYDYGNLFAAVDEYDSVHDLTFKMGFRSFPANQIIICHRSEYLKKIIEDHAGEKIIELRELSDLGLPCDIFELILRYIYTNQPIMKTEIERITVDYAQTFTMLKKVLTVMGLHELITALKKNSQKITTPFTPLKRTDFPEFYDVTLKLDCEQEIQAHKCILMSRLEYFNMMFDHSWAEQDTVNLKSVPIEFMQPIIDFLYSNATEEIRATKYSDNYMFNMITICDQFFVTELKTIFELMISEKIHVKNCGEILEFADTYNCETLRNCCMQYISLNFSRILELRTLESTEPKVLQQVNKFYRQFFSLVSYWTITPYANAVTDEELEQFVADFTVDLKANPDDGAKQKQKTKTIKPSKSLLDRRSYEKVGIIAMQEESSQNLMPVVSEDSKQQEFLSEMTQLTEKFESEAKLWTKVNDKKDVKKKQNSVLTSLKVNDILKTESKSSNSFTNLKATTPTTPKVIESPNSRSTIERTPEPMTPKQAIELTENSPRTKLTFSIADITPLKMKTKNRKRLSSGSTSDVRNFFQNESPTVAPVTPPNPWKTIPNIESSPLKSDPLPGPSTSSAAAVPKTPPATKSFQSIVNNERKQKQLIEKIKTKSLALTQLEEKCIEELHEFYNVDNIFDESITIERRQVSCDDDRIQCVKWYQDKK